VDAIWNKTATPIVAAIVLATVAQTARSQPTPFNGNYYEYVGAALNWTAARDAAAARSFGGVFGHLPTVTSQAENDFLFGLKPAPTQTFQGAWIGAKVASGIRTWDVGPEAGTALVYANWGGIEPNNGGVGQTGYGYMHIGSGNFAGILPGKWADAQNGIPGAGDPLVGYFVEYEAIPEPNTALLAALALAWVSALTGRNAGRPSRRAAIGT
jgi:hypothetical protein